MDLHCKIGAAQLALHALDAGILFNHFGDESIHFENPCGAEFDADAAPLAQPVNDLNSRTAHSHSLLFRDAGKYPSWVKTAKY
jgi:hypothetical protein